MAYDTKILKPMNFYFKANIHKLDTPERLNSQISNVAKRLADTHKLELKTQSIKIGTVNDDYLLNRFRVRISFN